MPNVATYTAGQTELLLGNEAIARGALEGGMKVAAAYPGTPSSEIVESLAAGARDSGIYVEWSVNEKVAAEVAAGATFAGLRALVAMKHEGLNVCLDYFAHLNLAGTVGGLVMVVGDDPGAWSSPGENDSRPLIRWLNVPLLEPGTAQEAKDMVAWAFELSEQLGLFVGIRAVTRLCHATGPVTFGPIPELGRKAHMDTSKMYVPTPGKEKHIALLKKGDKIKELFEDCPFNFYEGPADPDLLIVSAGVGRLYARDALKMLGLERRVGILHLATTFPLPPKFIQRHIGMAKAILVVEELEPFLEQNLILAVNRLGLSPANILGKGTGNLPDYGELTPDITARAIARALGIEEPASTSPYRERANELISELAMERDMVWCAGCPHRASFWAMKNAFRLSGRDPILNGDIGCYALDRRGNSGWQITRTASAMGSSAGVASGMGKLERFGLDQPVLSVCGDSTFFHAGIAGLINAVYNRSNYTMVVLDNATTAMTGHQPHAGIGRDALGDPAPKVDIETLCRSLGVDVTVCDPFDLEGTTATVLGLMERRDGVRVLILRQECALLRPREAKLPFKMEIDQERCLADACGCDRFCTRAFKCPGLMVDKVTGKATIDRAVCVGCGVCASVCPVEAITKEAANA